MWNLLGVVVFHTSMVNWRRGHWYMCILLYVKLMWCNCIPYIYGQLEGEGTSALSICAFSYRWNSFGVMVYHTSMVNWRGYICPKYMCISYRWNSFGVMVYIHLWSIGGGFGICAFCYMWNFCGVAVYHNLWSIGGGGISAWSICAFCYILKWCGVVVFHRSMVNWRRGTLVYVHSAICETSVV